MAIINLFDEYTKGTLYSESREFSKTAKYSKRVFLSHKSEDKDYVKIIADYLAASGYDIYLDEYDKFLQQAVSDKDKTKVVVAIKQAIQDSTHVLCFITNKTKQSWWVPFEIGIAEEKRKSIFSLKNIYISDSDLPEFLQIKPIIKTINELDFYFNITIHSSSNYFLASYVNLKSILKQI